MIFRKGVWAVLAVFIVYAALYWNYVITATELPIDAQLSYFVASCAAICMVLGMILAARPRVSEISFGGLDKMYKLHKYLGVAALLLFIAHFATVPGGPDEVEAANPSTVVATTSTAPVEAERDSTASTQSSTPPVTADTGGEKDGGLPIDTLGLIAMIGFLLLLFITLNRKFSYHRWYSTHRFMGLFFIVAAVHIGMVLYINEAIPMFSAPGVVLLLLVIAGVVAFVYKQFFYPKREKHRFSLVELNRLERATEVVLEPNGEMFPFEAGQFAFITIDSDGFKEAHPFTISSGAKESRLRFTMKMLGDYTRRVRDELTAGADADIEGPYGRFNPLRGRTKQVWIAGGIGITPFLSAIRTIEKNHGKTIRLYYCVRDAKEALFIDELEDRVAEVDCVTVTRLHSSNGERISADMVKKDIGDEIRDWEFYFCGPKPMTAAISADLVKLGALKRRIHKEEFEFR